MHNKKKLFLIFTKLIISVIILFSTTSLLYINISMYTILLESDFATAIVILQAKGNAFFETLLLLIVWIINWLWFISLNKKYMGLLNE